MDFNAFEVETDKPVFVQFKNPFTGLPLFEQMLNPDDPEGDKIDDPSKPVGVNLFGQDSEPFIKRRRFLLDKRLADAQKNGIRPMKPEDIDKQNLDTVVACIHSFTNVEWKGETLGERRDLFPHFFAKHQWAFEFCNRAIGDRANFSKASQTG